MLRRKVSLITVERHFGQTLGDFLKGPSYVSGFTGFFQSVLCPIQSIGAVRFYSIPKGKLTSNCGNLVAAFSIFGNNFVRNENYQFSKKSRQMGLNVQF